MTPGVVASTSTTADRARSFTAPSSRFPSAGGAVRRSRYEHDGSAADFVQDVRRDRDWTVDVMSTDDVTTEAVNCHV
jgi:hypothetical protein